MQKISTTFPLPQLPFLIRATTPFGTASFVTPYAFIIFLVPAYITNLLGLTGIIETVCYVAIFIGLARIFNYFINRYKNVPYIAGLSDEGMKKLPKMTSTRKKIAAGIILAWAVFVILVIAFSNKFPVTYTPLCVTLFLSFILVVNYFENTWREEDAKNQQIE